MSPKRIASIAIVAGFLVFAIIFSRRILHVKRELTYTDLVFVGQVMESESDIRAYSGIARVIHSVRYKVIKVIHGEYPDTTITVGYIITGYEYETPGEPQISPKIFVKDSIRIAFADFRKKGIDTYFPIIFQRKGERIEIIAPNLSPMRNYFWNRWLVRLIKGNKRSTG